MRPAFLPLLALAVVAGPPARADDDHDRARAAVARGEVLALATLLDRVPLREGERLLDAELEREDGRWIYELELIDRDGRVREIELDARDGRRIEDD